MKKPELLAPAGNIESLKAAIHAGCDAVYIGGKLFGARSYASNFSDEEIKEAIKYAHIYGVKVYITVNTLIFENEVQEFMEYIDFIHKNNVDAIIIQDLGMMYLIRQTYPNLEIHTSTQMHVHNKEAIKLLKKIGVKRVVLAREMSLEEIKEIKKEIDMDIEVFIHGALCVSYSGQCLMSYFQGGRSGNRGTCAQCCRMPYDLISNNQKINQENYLLSTKDLNTINNIPDLIESNIDSLKIEGRMKRPEYVYIVTKIYRKAIDNYIKYKKTNISQKDIKSLLKIFNRKFTKGFLFNEKNNEIINQYRPNHMGINLGKIISYNNNFAEIKLYNDVNQNDGIRILNKKEDIGFNLNKIYKNKKLVNSAKKGEIISIYVETPVNQNDQVIKTTDIKEMNEIKQQLTNFKKIKIKVKLKCLKNKNLEIKFTDYNNKGIIISDYICEKAKTSPTSKERIEKQIKRLKDTPYEIDDLEIEMNDVFIDIKELNKIRREMVDILNNKRCYKIKYKKEKYTKEVYEYDYTKELSVYIKNDKLKNKLKIKNVYTDYEDQNTIQRLPRIMNKFKENNQKLLISELGSLNKYKNIITDFTFNVTNSYTVAFLNNLKAKLITLSYENTDENIENILKNYIKRYNKKPNLELIISSYPEVMISKFNLLKQFNISKAYLKNQKNSKFKILDNEKYITIYNHEKIIKNDFQKYYNMGINSLRVELNDEEDLKLIEKISKNK